MKEHLQTLTELETERILERARLEAEEVLLDQRLFIVSDSQTGAFLQLLDRPAKENAGLRDLFAKPAPWDI